MNKVENILHTPGGVKNKLMDIIHTYYLCIFIEFFLSPYWVEARWWQIASCSVSSPLDQHGSHWKKNEKKKKKKKKCFLHPFNQPIREDSRGPWLRPSLVWLHWIRSRFPGWNCWQLCFLLSWTHCCAGNWMCIWLVPRSGQTTRLLGPTFTTSQNVIRSSWLIAFLWYDSIASLLSGFMLMGHRILLMWCQGDVMQTTYHSVGLADLRSWDCSRVNGQWHVSLIWRFLKMTPRCVRVRCCLHGVVWHLLSQVLILWSCCAVTIPANTASRKLCAGCYGWNLAWWNEPHRLALSRLQKCLLLRRWS